MKIGIDVRVLGQGGYGGVAEYIKNVVPLLVLNNKEHFFYLFYNSFFDRGVDVLGILGLKVCDNVRLYNFRYPNKVLFFSSYFNGLKFDRMMGVNDMDVFFSPHILPVSLSADIPRVVMFHDLSFVHFPDFFDLKRRLWHFYVQPKKQAQKADIIITPSMNTKNDLIELYGVESAKIHNIPLGASKVEYNDDSFEKFRKEFSIPEKYILSLCTFEPRKNIVGIIRAFEIACQDRSMDGVSLVISGGAGWKYDDIITEYLSASVRSRIIITGAVQDKYKWGLYKNAMAFVFPSFYEGFGLPPLEAMSCGVPVICSFTSSLPEVIGDSAILVDPYNVPVIAKSIVEIVSDERLRNDLSKKGTERARQFSWEKTAEQTMAIFYKAVKNS